MPDSDSCASASSRETRQRHSNSNSESRHRRHPNTDTDLDAGHSVDSLVTMDGPPLASLSLTHVHYDPTNKISHACAFLALVPQALCITYATLIWSTREMEILLMFAGQMGCEALNWVLKRFIREDRPAQMLGKGYGMPSSHAQFVAFFAVYLGLWVVVRHDPWKNTESKTHVPTPMWQRVGLALLAIGGAVAVAQSRMYALELDYRPVERVLTFS
jgi:dolichyldiphosphatase